MKTFRNSALAVAAVLLCQTGGNVFAQGGIAPLNQPAYSPYLNLYRNGAPIYQNYYGLVRPEQDFRNQLNQQQNYGQNGIPDQSYNPGGPASQFVTGHPAVFLSTGGYFPNNGTPGNQQLGGSPNIGNRTSNLGGINTNSGGFNNFNNFNGNNGFPGANYGNFGGAYGGYGGFGPNYNYSTPRVSTYTLPGVVPGGSLDR